MNRKVLEVKNLNIRLSVGKKKLCVVEDLSFNLHAGKTLALVGESGSGKTMTALSLLRILPTPPALPPEGIILYEGRNLLKASEKEMRTIRGARIAMIFQDPHSALNPVYTIGDQLIEVISLHLNLYGQQARERALQALHEVGIPVPEERFNTYPHQISGGMKQRVMIAMALLCEPDILIADEPTTALDVTIQAQVLELMRNLQKTREMAILLITHDMGVVAEMADDVLVLYAAKEVEQAPVRILFDQMSHPYTQALFNSRPHLHRDKKTLEAIPGSVPQAHTFPEGCRFHPRCPKRMPQCMKGVVPCIERKHTGHRIHCWLYENPTS